MSSSACSEKSLEASGAVLMLAGDLQNSAAGISALCDREEALSTFTGDLQTTAGSITTFLDREVVASALTGDPKASAGNMTACLGQGVVVPDFAGDLQISAGNMTAGLGREEAVPEFAAVGVQTSAGSTGACTHRAAIGSSGFALGVASAPLAGALRISDFSAESVQLQFPIFIKALEVVEGPILGEQLLDVEKDTSYLRSAVTLHNSPPLESQ